jgi:hypothetical protein
VGSGMKDPPGPEEGPRGEAQEEEVPITGVGFYVYTREKVVILAFERPVDFLAMPAPDAMRLGKTLFERGKKALRGQGGKIVQS